MKGPSPGPILAAYANGQTHHPIPDGPRRRPVARRGPRPPVHRAGPRAGRVARSAGRLDASAAGEGGRQRHQTAHGSRARARPPAHRRRARAATCTSRRTSAACSTSPTSSRSSAATTTSRGSCSCWRPSRTRARSAKLLQRSGRVEGRHREGHRPGARRREGERPERRGEAARRSRNTPSTSPARATSGKLDPVIGRDDEIRRTMQVLAAPHEEQPRSHRRAGRGQDGHCRRPRPAHRQRRGARGPQEQAHPRARHGRADRGRQVPRRVRGAPQGRAQRSLEAGRPDHPVHRRAAHHGRRRQSRGRHGCGQHARSPRSRAASCIACGATTLDEYRKYIEKDAALERRFQKVLVGRAVGGGHHRHPAWAEGALRGAPQGGDHGPGHRRRRDALAPLHRATGSCRTKPSISSTRRPRASGWRSTPSPRRWTASSAASSSSRSSARRSRREATTASKTPPRRSAGRALSAWRRNTPISRKSGRPRRPSLQGAAQIKEELERAQARDGKRAPRGRPAAPGRAAVRHAFPSSRSGSAQARRPRSKQTQLRAQQGHGGGDRRGRLEVDRHSRLQDARRREGEAAAAWSRRLRDASSARTRRCASSRTRSAARAPGLSDPRRPNGSFLFLGPTGVGKTELSQGARRVSVRHRGGAWCASTCRSSWRSTPWRGSSARRRATSATRRAASSPRPCAAGRIP